MDTRNRCPMRGMTIGAMSDAMSSFVSIVRKRGLPPGRKFKVELMWIVGEVQGWLGRCGFGVKQYFTKLNMEQQLDLNCNSRTGGKKVKLHAKYVYKFELKRSKVPLNRNGTDVKRGDVVSPYFCMETLQVV